MRRLNVLAKFKFVFFVLGFVCIERLCHTATDGFSIQRIKPLLQTQLNWSPLPPTEEIHTALDQPFHYLGSGSQSFVFESDDGQYVLKFFKLRGGFYKWHKRKQRAQSFIHAFDSCLIYQNEMFQDAALLYCHLAISDYLLPHVQIKDLMGHIHEITLCQFPFVLQRKAKSVETHLNELNDPIEAEKALSSIFDLMVKRYKKGYSDKDPHPINNFGFVDGRAVYIDISGIAEGRYHLHDYFVNRELDKAEQKAVKWLRTHHPELIEVTRQKIHAIKAELN